MNVPQHQVAFPKVHPGWGFGSHPRGEEGGWGTRYPPLLGKKIGRGLYELERGLQTAFGSCMRRG